MQIISKILSNTQTINSIALLHFHFKFKTFKMVSDWKIKNRKAWKNCCFPLFLFIFLLLCLHFQDCRLMGWLDLSAIFFWNFEFLIDEIVDLPEITAKQRYIITIKLTQVSELLGTCVLFGCPSLDGESWNWHISGVLTSTNSGVWFTHTCCNR